ncbi:hypothetical protein [Cumulibacter manganitolerans]|uniref:hypothetical protein n=1 Tax=Cumulibacter manganitolerans TaxID=1884992 RepID=UPI0012956C10|nr:hypothetical protein [Cumulibacter manganitolerans]
MSTRPARRPHHPALPQAWPSAWPSLLGGVLLGAVLPVVAAAVVVVILLLTSSLATAWWVVLLPLLLLAWPLSLPARVRRVMQDASDAGRLDVVQGTLGALATAPERRLGVRPNAEVVPGAAVRYFLNPRTAPGRRGTDRT